MNCSKCGSVNGKEKSGVSKSTGRPWKGWFCDDCKEVTWIKVKPTKTASEAIIRPSSNLGTPTQNEHKNASEAILSEIKAIRQTVSAMYSLLKLKNDPLERATDEAQKNVPF